MRPESSGGQPPGTAHKVTTGDYVLAGILVVLSLVSFRLVGLFGEPRGEREVVIYVDGRRAATAVLAEDKTISPIAKGVDMSVEIKGGSARVLHANCPHGLCKNAGGISKAGQSIVCVPNKVVIAIEGRDASEYQAESY